MKTGSCHDGGIDFEGGSTGLVNQQPAWTSPTRIVGKRTPRIDAYERVSGSAMFTFDVVLPGMLYAEIVRCPHTHARVKSVDTSRAENMPGARAVLTAADLLSELSLPAPWWVEDSRPLILFDAHCRHQGDEVAAVAADTQTQAADAAGAVVVEYEPLPFVSRFEEALKPGAPAIHDGGNVVRKPSAYNRGDIEKGFGEADFVVEQTYRTSDEFQSCMEPHVSVAQWDGDRLTVWDSNQGVYDIRSDIAKAFAMPLSSVRVISKYIGGGYGCKAELGEYTAIAILLARKTGRPVKCGVRREHVFLTCGNRPANLMTLKAGVKKDGTITAMQVTSLGSVGAYVDWATTSGQVSNMYLCPNMRIEETEVFTNTGKIRSMRAPGSPQGSWALEQSMDVLAEKIGMDPVEFRARNVPLFAQRWGNRPATSTGLKQCLLEGAKAFGWDAARQKSRGSGTVVRGVGVAACLWGIGAGPPATAIVKLFPDGSVNLNIGASDLGTGTKTVMAMVVAEELGVLVNKIQVEHADTATTQYSPVSGGSMTVATTSPAVQAAAADARRQLLTLAAEELKVPADQLILRDGRVFPAEKPEQGKAFSELKSLQDGQGVIGVGHRGPNTPGKVSASFGAQFAEVEVDTRTGEVRVLRMLAAHDSGRVLNPLTFENQIFGGLTMGVGFALTERRVLDGKQTGKLLNGNWHDYKVPTAKDVPGEQSWLSIDPHDSECNTTGTKGIGEPATIPTAPAIANAIYNATGIRFSQAPITPADVLRMLRAKRMKS